MTPCLIETIKIFAQNHLDPLTFPADVDMIKHVEITSLGGPKAPLAVFNLPVFLGMPNLEVLSFYSSGFNFAGPMPKMNKLKQLGLGIMENGLQQLGDVRHLSDLTHYYIDGTFDLTKNSILVNDTLSYLRVEGNIQALHRYWWDVLKEFCYIVWHSDYMPYSLTIKSNADLIWNLFWLKLNFVNFRLNKSAKTSKFHEMGLYFDDQAWVENFALADYRNDIEPSHSTDKLLAINPGSPSSAGKCFKNFDRFLCRARFNNNRKLINLA